MSFFFLVSSLESRVLYHGRTAHFQGHDAETETPKKHQVGTKDWHNAKKAHEVFRKWLREDVGEYIRGK